MLPGFWPNLGEVVDASPAQPPAALPLPRKAQAGSLRRAWRPIRPCLCTVGAPASGVGLPRLVPCGSRCGCYRYACFRGWEQENVARRRAKLSECGVPRRWVLGRVVGMMRRRGWRGSCIDRRRSFGLTVAASRNPASAGARRPCSARGRVSQVAEPQSRPAAAASASISSIVSGRDIP